jgi:hypothetical protein
VFYFRKTAIVLILKIKATGNEDELRSFRISGRGACSALPAWVHKRGITRVGVPILFLVLPVG